MRGNRRSGTDGPGMDGPGTDDLKTDRPDMDGPENERTIRKRIGTNGLRAERTVHERMGHLVRVIKQLCQRHIHVTICGLVTFRLYKFRQHPKTINSSDHNTDL